MGEFNIHIFLSIKIDDVVDIGNICRPVEFSYEWRRILGSDVTRTKTQLVNIFNRRITAHLS
jgi:hypothetical protein